MGRILGNAIAAVPEFHTQTCLRRLDVEVDKFGSRLSTLERSVDDTPDPTGGVGTVTNTGGDLTADLVILGAGGADVKTLPTTSSGKFLRDDATWQTPSSTPATTIPAIIHIVSVVDKYGVAVAGRTLTITVHYDDGATLAVAAVPADRSAATVTDLGGGDYRVVFSPTHKSSLYRTRIASSVATDVVSPQECQDIVFDVVT